MRILNELGFKNYQGYLDSDLWEMIRKRVLLKDNYRCRCCGGAAYMVHHNSYDKATMEGATIDELYSLCSSCHEWVGGHTEYFGFEVATYTEEREHLKALIANPSLLTAPKPPQPIRTP
jgi:5-methylcytosine-specific restriction endonuclease McrA